MSDVSVIRFHVCIPCIHVVPDVFIRLRQSRCTEAPILLIFTSITVGREKTRDENC